MIPLSFIANHANSKMTPFKTDNSPKDITLVTGISGGSAAGKTMVANLLAELLCPFGSPVLAVDRYFYDQRRLSPKERAKLNYDVPKAINFNQLAKDIRNLKNGQKVRVPAYDYATHAAIPEKELVYPAKLLIVEGILLFNSNEIKPLLDFKIYVDAKSEERLRRRIARDTVERGRTKESVIKQFYETVEPAFLKYTEPTRDDSDITLDWNIKDLPALKLLADKIASLVLY